MTASNSPDTRKRQGRVPAQVSEGTWPQQYLDFGWVASRTGKQIAVVFKAPTL